MILLFGFMGKLLWGIGGLALVGGIAFAAMSNPLIMAWILKNKGIVIGLAAAFVLAYFYSDYKSLQSEVAVLKKDNDAWVDVNKQRNAEVVEWQKLAAAETAKVAKAEAENKQNTKDAADRMAKLTTAALKFTSNCPVDVDITLKEFARMAAPPKKTKPVTP